VKPFTLTNGLLLLLILLVTWGLYKTPTLQSITTTKTPHTISITAKASREVVPNIATFSFTIRALHHNQTKASDEVNQKTNAILKKLTALNIAKTAIQTKQYRVNPRYSYHGRKQELEGYEVSQMVHIRLKALEKMPKLLTTLTESKVNNLQGPNMKVDVSDTLYETLQNEAIENAKTKAKRVAKKLGITLEKVVGFSEQQHYHKPHIPRAYSMTRAESNTAPITPPTIEHGVEKVEKSVTLLFLVEE
jgi:uncharacterized protein YggE